MTRDPQGYEPTRYWSRLHEQGSLRSVGQSGLPLAFNVWLYRIGRHNVLAFLRRQGLASLAGRRVFDVGAGTGYWTALWRELGATHVDGCDLVEIAVARLREQFPGSTFTAGDIAEPGTIPDDGSYDLVTIMNVLLHILDEERFEAAARAAARAVAPGGLVFLAEPALSQTDVVSPPAPAGSSIARPLRRYREVFEATGLEFVAHGASTVVGANPIERGDPHFAHYLRLWNTAGRWARRGRRPAALTGRLLAAADRLLMRTGAAPSGKLLLFRRPA